MLNIFQAKPFKGQKEIDAIAISPDGEEAVTGSHPPQFLDRDAIVWDLPSGRIARRLKGHGVGVFSAAYSPDATLIATGGGGVVKGSQWVYDHAIRLWNRHGEPGGVFGEDLFFVRALTFSPDGRTLLSGSSNHAPKSPKSIGASLRLWDPLTCQEVQRFGRHSSGIHTVAFSPDGKRVVAGSTGMKADGRIPGWNSSNSLSDLEDRTLRVWVVDSGAEIPMFAYSGWINALAFHPNGDFLFSAGKELICWDCRNGKRREIFECAVNGGFINCAALSPDGKHFAIGTGGQDEPGAPFQNCFVRVLDSQSGSNVAEMPHRFPVNRLAFSPDGNYVLAGGKFGELHYWPVTA